MSHRPNIRLNARGKRPIHIELDPILYKEMQKIKSDLGLSYIWQIEKGIKLYHEHLDK